MDARPEAFGVPRHTLWRFIEAVARAERGLAGGQAEEDRAIRLDVTGKITEDQLDHQRRFAGERLERLRARRDEYRRGSRRRPAGA